MEKSKKNNYLISKVSLAILIVFFISSGIVLAQTSDTFTIGQEVTGDGDTEAPTVPTNLSATAISSSQIDLSWTASTDNTAVTGYKIFRDNVEIDTTISTTYSDSGLEPSTTYTYEVSAFDAADNESARSNEASATTLSTGISGGSVSLEIVEFSVQPDLNKATIKIRTNLLTRLFFRWGETSDYELGYIDSVDSRKIHEVVLTNLNPDTLYHFEFEVVEDLGDKIKVTNQTFRTLTLPTDELLLNVNNLNAEADEEKIILTWENPPITFDVIRIIRSDKFFPRDPFDGELVFEGVAEEFIDNDVLPKIIYYYAVFVKDSRGSYSSGALTHARLIDGEFPFPPDLFAGVVDLPPSEVHPEIRELTLRDFEFIQDGNQAKFLEDDTVLIKGDRTFKVLVDYEKLPEILKTIAMVIRDPEEPKKFFSFLLRVNQDKTAFEASIAPLGREGFFGLNVSVLDHKNRGLKKLDGILRAILPFGPISIPLKGSEFLFWLFFALILILFLILFFRSLNKKRVVFKEYYGKAN